MKYSIAIIVGAVILGGFYYYTEHEKLVSTQEKTQVKTEQEGVQKQLTPEKNIETKSETPARIIAQLKNFDDYLEYSLVGAQVDCTVFATYNNFALTGQMDTQAFPNSKESYESTCRTSYLDVLNNQKILIAEPELQSLRTLLTSYTEEVKAFSQYTLNGGSQSTYIDNADKKMDNLRTLSREEILKLKRKYNLN